MARQEESERIISRLNTDDYVILLDERGRIVDSPSLSKLIRSPMDQAKQLLLL